MKLYIHPISGHSHRAVAIVKLLGIDVELVTVDLSEGEHKQPQFLSINPLGQVPVLADDSITLRDSAAILVYLATKYDRDRVLFPEDINLQAQIQQWLATSVNEISNGPAALRAIKVLGSLADVETAESKTNRALNELFEPHLTANEWLVGDHITIADIANYSYLKVIDEGGIDLEPYPGIRAWLQRVEAVEGFVPMKKIEDIFAVLKSKK